MSWTALKEVLGLRVAEHATDMPAVEVFQAGDFHCVMPPEDVWGGALDLGNKRAGVPQLAAAGLQDVWGTMHGSMATEHRWPLMPAPTVLV